MAGQLIPEPELAPPLLTGLTSKQRIEVWLDLMDACEQFLLAGLAHKAGPGGDIWALYRQWYRAQMEEHDRTMARMLERLARAERNRAE